MSQGFPGMMGITPMKERLKPCVVQFGGTTKMRPGTTMTFNQQPQLPLKLKEFIVPRWARYFLISEIRVGRNTQFITSAPLPAWNFRRGSPACKLVEGEVCNVGQLITVSAEFIGGSTIMLNCTLRENAKPMPKPGPDFPRPKKGKWKQLEWDDQMKAFEAECRKQSLIDYPYSWKDIDHPTLRLLHPQNPRHLYEVGIRYDYTWEIPPWIHAHIDCPVDKSQWPEEFQPDPEIDQGTLDDLCFNAFMTADATEF